MYVVKVGEYYVARADIIEEQLSVNSRKYYIGDIVLSKEVKIHIQKSLAFKLANRLNGKVIEMSKEASCD